MSGSAEPTLGHTKDSQSALEGAIAKQAHTGAYDIAAAFVWRGEYDEAFHWLERAYAQREGALSELKVDPLLAAVREDPRYRELLGKMNLLKAV